MTTNTRLVCFLHLSFSLFIHFYFFFFHLSFLVILFFLHFSIALLISAFMFPLPLFQSVLRPYYFFHNFFHLTFCSFFFLSCILFILVFTLCSLLPYLLASSFHICHIIRAVDIPPFFPPFFPKYQLYIPKLLYI